MRLQQGNGSPWSDLNHNNETVKKSGRMPYVCVRENAVKWWVSDVTNIIFNPPPGGSPSTG